MNPTKKITFIHLYNDFSGSPLVLANVIQGIRDAGYQCKVITSRNTEGFLSDIKDVEYDYFNYRFLENKYFRLFYFLFAQFILFFKIVFQKNNNSIIYINTLLPFGAAIGASLRRQVVVYHLHEISIKPILLKRFLKWIAQNTASSGIYVSKYLERTEKLKNVSGNIIYNALSDNFIKTAEKYKSEQCQQKIPFTVLMLCSLKVYKGINEFVLLAEKLPNINFSLVISSSQSAIDSYFKNKTIPENLKTFSSQKNVHPIYQKSHIVLNLSHPDQWIETFGMTILEGMYYGLPCIAPPVGGPVEIVNNAVNGYLIDQRNIEEIALKISKLAEDKSLYTVFSQNALKRALDFKLENKITGIKNILQTLNT